MSRLNGAFASTLNFLRQHREKCSEATRAAAEAGLKLIYDESQRLVPVSIDGSYGFPPGSLKESGYFTVFGGGGEARVFGVVSYGGGRVHYAGYVHEISTYNHAWPTQWKYIDQAVRNVWSQLSPAMGKYFEITLGSF